MAKLKAILIGVTGQIGAGKSTVANILQSLGCHVISGDELGRQVLDSNSTVRKRLAKVFGGDILLPNGMINRSELGRRAFASEVTRRRLNAIVHPPLLKKLDRQISQCRKKEPVVVIDATLLIEWGYHKKMDQIIVVIAPKELRHRWLTARGIARKDIRARESLQLTKKEFKSYATKVLSNSGSIPALRSSVAAWLKSIRNTGVDRIA